MLNNCKSIFHQEILFKYALLLMYIFSTPQELIDDFIFPASKAYLQYVRSGELPATQTVPVCSSPTTISAGFELLVTLAVGCVKNLKQIADCLTEMYYIGTAITSK